MTGEGDASIDGLLRDAADALADADTALVRTVARAQQLGDLAALQAAAQQSAGRLQAALDAATDQLTRTLAHRRLSRTPVQDVRAGIPAPSRQEKTDVRCISSE